MPITPTYPGVYIEEIPSGVRTLVGVSTAITAFVGYTARGQVDKPVRIFSVADYERSFGGLASDSPLSYCVKDFFQNGGTDAYIVRVAQGASAATVTMQNAARTDVLTVTAASAGTWGNNLQIDVDYATANPSSLLNLRVTDYEVRNGQLVARQTEVFRNLSMSNVDPNYVIDKVNAESRLITVALAAPINIPPGGEGRSISGAFPNTFTLNVDNAHNRLAFMLDGQGPFEIILANAAAAVPTDLDTIALDIVAKINALVGAGSVTHIGVGVSGTNTITIVSTDTTVASSVHFLNASQNNAAAIVQLGLANGGTEIDAVANFRPVQTGTTGTALGVPTTPDGGITIDVIRGAATVVQAGIPVPIWGPPTTLPQPTTLDQVAIQLSMAIVNAAMTQPFLVGATAQLIGTNTIRILPGPDDPNISFVINELAGTTATDLGLISGTGVQNVARYAPGSGLGVLFQTAGVMGNNGTPPTQAELRGALATKTGLYALEDVDLFNLLVMPDATVGTGLMGVLTEAIAYCTRRRAFMIIDAPENVADFAQAFAWIGGPASPLRSRNAALFSPGSVYRIL